MSIPTDALLRFAGRALCLALLFLVPAPGPARAAPAFRVFVLHSYSQEYPWTRGQHDGFVRALAADTKVSTLVNVEYLDTKRRAYDDAYAQELARHLRLKYAGYRPSAVYVTDDDALRFARDHLSHVFPGAPVFFSGVNDYAARATLDPARFTGVFERKEVGPNVDWLLGVDKGANDLVFVGDGSSTYRAIEADLRRDLARYPQLRVTFLADRRLDRLLERLHDLGGRYVFLTTLGGMTGEGGRELALPEILGRLAGTGRVLVSMEDAYVREGVLGGFVTSGPRQGEAAARLLLAHLHGTPVARLEPVTKSPNALLFDYRVLQRHHVDLGAEVRDRAALVNPPLAFYEQRRSLILGLLVGLAVLSFFAITASYMMLSRKNRELVAANAAAEEANALFRQLAEESRTVHWTVDADGVYTAISPVSRSVFGYLPEEIVGKKHFGELHSRGEQEATGPTAADALLAREPFLGLESVARTAEGRRFWVLTDGIPLRTAHGEFGGFRGSDRDITERKEADATAEAQRERLATAVETAGLGFYEQRERKGDVFLDDGARALLGCNAEGHGEVTSFWLSHVHPEDQSAIVEIRRRLAGDGADRATGEYRYLHPERGVVWLHHAVRVLERNARGEVVRQLGVLRDVTEAREAEAERAEMAEHLRRAQRMESIGTLAGGIAHDFNNILTPIMVNAELALMRLGDDDPGREMLGEILVAAERARDLVRQILAIARKDPEGALTPTPLGPLVTEFGRFLRASLPSSIEIRTEVAPGCGAVLGDHSQLHQVLLNLCTNAGHAMQERGGVLTVSLAPAAAEEGGRWVRLSVRDTGPGIHPAILERIFEPYFTTKPVGKGTGLGLAVVRAVVTNLGGKLRVESTPGEGTLFETLLPETASADPALEAELRESPRGLGQHVLVVDDEGSIQTVLRKMLLALGYRVSTYATGTEALAAFGADPWAFDAVVTDYTMPGMSGLDLAGELLRIRPDLPVVLGTGYAEAVTDEVVARMGLRALLMKPYTAQKLSETLRRALGAA